MRYQYAIKMVKITEIVNDGILEIILPKQEKSFWVYKIVCPKGTIKLQGKIDGFTQRTCLYIGELIKGNYQFIMNDSENGIPFKIV